MAVFSNTRTMAALLCLSLHFVSAYKRGGFDIVQKSHRRIADRSWSASGKGSQKRDDTKYVFMHHIVGNTHSYSQSDWESDIQQIHANGVDAIALNMGSDQWEVDQIASAYAAAEASGPDHKLFISFDFTSWPCDVAATVAQAKLFTSHPNQFMVDGKPMISSYEGACIGEEGWEQVKAQTGAYLMPFVSGQEGKFDSWPSWDSWFSWGSAWSQDATPKTTADDEFYIGQLGDRYAATVSGGFYAHYDYKNRILLGDDWLAATRWEQLFSLRDKLTFVEMVTWNDFGESDYYGPIKGSQPAGTTWASGYDHTPWFDLSKYYITAFKSGKYPDITNDTIYYWARPHPAAATAKADPLPRPDNADWTSDHLWAVVFATAPGSVTLASGSSSQTFDNVTAGVNKLKVALAPGNITVSLARDGNTLISKTDTTYSYTESPELYNYNFYVGSASA